MGRDLPDHAIQGSGGLLIPELNCLNSRVSLLCVERVSRPRIGNRRYTIGSRAVNTFMTAVDI